MISTAITTTVATALFGGVAVIGLIALLVTRELAAASKGWAFRRVNRNIAVAVVPLLIVFAFIVVVNVLEIIFD